MRLSQFFVGSVVLSSLMLGVAQAGHAQTVTLSAGWYASQLTGTTGGGLLSVTGTGSPVAANSSNSWDIVADLGVTKLYTFSNALSATVFDSGTAVDNLIRETKIDFTGAGSTNGDVKVTQAITAYDLGTSGRLVFNNSTTKQFLTNPSPSYGYLWSAKFNAEPQYTDTFSGGQMSYTWPTNTMNVTLIAVIPEPATLALLGLGLAPVAFAIRRRK